MPDTSGLLGMPQVRDRRDPPEYAIAGSYQEFVEWRRQDPELRGDVIYLFNARRAEELAVWAPMGKLHRIGTWETSPAREVAEKLEILED